MLDPRVGIADAPVEQLFELRQTGPAPVAE
jgi:hypothetical protein